MLAHPATDVQYSSLFSCVAPPSKFYNDDATANANDNENPNNENPNNENPNNDKNPN